MASLNDEHNMEGGFKKAEHADKEPHDPRTGMLIMTDEERAKGDSSGCKGAFIAPVLFTGVGIGLAYITHAIGDTDLYQIKIAAMAAYDLQWLYLLTFIYTIFVQWMNM
jgi:hypothetical protein